MPNIKSISYGSKVIAGVKVDWLDVLRIYIALAVFQPYRDLEAGDNQSLKFKWRGGGGSKLTTDKQTDRQPGQKKYYAPDHSIRGHENCYKVNSYKISAKNMYNK